MTSVEEDSLGLHNTTSNTKNIALDCEWWSWWSWMMLLLFLNCVFIHAGSIFKFPATCRHSGQARTRAREWNVKVSLMPKTLIHSWGSSEIRASWAPLLCVYWRQLIKHSPVITVLLVDVVGYIIISTYTEFTTISIKIMPFIGVIISLIAIDLLMPA